MLSALTFDYNFDNDLEIMPVRIVCSIMMKAINRDEKS